MWTSSVFCFFFFNDTATTEIYTLSLHDALPILLVSRRTPLVSRGAAMVSRSTPALSGRARGGIGGNMTGGGRGVGRRSEEHTSELQSQSNLVCRLLLEKKKNQHLLSCPRLTRRQ